MSGQSAAVSAPTTLTDMTKQLVQSGKYSDVKFLVGFKKTEVEAHKLILMLRSSVFAAMLDNDWTEESKSGVIELPGVDPDDFKIFLEFLYTDQLNINLVKGRTLSIIQIMDLAVKYDIQHLVNKCSEYAAKNLTIENCIKFLECGLLYGQAVLELGALNFIKSCSKDLLEHEYFGSMKKSTLITLLADGFNAKQILIWNAVMIWVKKECKRSKMEFTCENQREILGDILPYINFINMTPEEFTTNVPRGLLTDEEEVGIYREICNPNYGTYASSSRRIAQETATTAAAVAEIAAGMADPEHRVSITYRIHRPPSSTPIEPRIHYLDRPRPLRQFTSRQSSAPTPEPEPQPQLPTQVGIGMNVNPRQPPRPFCEERRDNWPDNLGNSDWEEDD